jgi:hypothetical protein
MWVPPFATAQTGSTSSAMLVTAYVSLIFGAGNVMLTFIEYQNSKTTKDADSSFLFQIFAARDPAIYSGSS